MQVRKWGALKRSAGGWAAWLGGAAVLLNGCEALDLPPAGTEGLPEAAITYLAPDQSATFQLEDGVIYRSIRSGRHPWSVHLLEVDVSRCDLGFRVVRADDAGGRAAVSEMARRSEPGVIAAVNGDFFDQDYLPLGIEVSDGILRRGRNSRPVFAWRPGEIPWIGSIEPEESAIRFGSWSLSQLLPDPTVQVVAGFPPLLRSGIPVGDLELAERPDFAAAREPRTAVGLDLARATLWIVVVDGRREGRSEGMTLPELVTFLRALGVGEAINLDGGGSSVMVVRRAVVNRPSGPLGERPVVNALVLRRDPTYCGAH